MIGRLTMILDSLDTRREAQRGEQARLTREIRDIRTTLDTLAEERETVQRSGETLEGWITMGECLDGSALISAIEAPEIETRGDLLRLDGEIAQTNRTIGTAEQALEAVNTALRDLDRSIEKITICRDRAQVALNKKKAIRDDATIVELGTMRR